MPREKSSTSISTTLGRRGAWDCGHQGEEVEKLVEGEVGGHEHNPSLHFLPGSLPSSEHTVQINYLTIMVLKHIDHRPWLSPKPSTSSREICGRA